MLSEIIHPFSLVSPRFRCLTKRIIGFFSFSLKKDVQYFQKRLGQIKEGITKFYVMTDIFGIAVIEELNVLSNATFKKAIA